MKKVFAVGMVIGGAIIALGFLFILSAQPSNWIPNIFAGLLFIFCGLFFALYVFWATIGSYVYNICKKRVKRWLAREQ